jgi:predicted Zn-ribbon and HTH transcriptional regulator
MSDLLLIKEFWEEKDWGRIMISYQENRDKQIIRILKEIAQTGLTLEQILTLITEFYDKSDIYYDLQANALIRVVPACIELGFVYEVGKLKYPPQTE